MEGCGVGGVELEVPGVSDAEVGDDEVDGFVVCVEKDEEGVVGDVFAAIATNTVP